VHWGGREICAVYCGCVPVVFERKPFLSRFINWHTFTVTVPNETEAAIEQSIVEISKLVSDSEALRRVQERLHYVFPFLTMTGSVWRDVDNLGKTVMDMTTLFYAELSFWVPAV